MSASMTQQPVTPGEPAPDFALPAVADAETVSLSDYRGRSPLFLALLIGLWCPFCRRQLVEIGKYEGKLKELGVESLVVVATEPENARLYFKFRPTKLRLASDPYLTTHRAFGVPKPEPTPEMLEAIGAIEVNPWNELPAPMPIPLAAKALDAIDGYSPTPSDQLDVERQWPQLKACFMIDREGIVRWVDIECQREGLAGIGKLPSEAMILEAARTVVH
ncbi:redoxin domain-containing protein [Variovorax sp. J22R133]|uniref:redoxin domain-containing protein n=1 Tax=Variovorax brevis TaxID=3053503 RepID=UPI0025776AF1|nr:redoxin domain-containing protein [Variovorax sp. J22R133]MDM0116557.1 redoxin domain-containing protein [Variovorax sp. J22R133]